MKLAARHFGYLMAILLSTFVPKAVYAQPSTYLDFRGRFLAILSDADMVASAYIDEQLGDRTSEMTDTLTLIPLGNNSPNASIATIPVSNSVMGWPNNLAFTPDGRFAFVTETFGSAPEGATQRSEIPLGRQLSVIDLSNPQQPRVVDQLILGNRPMAVAVHPEGNLLAVSLGESGRQIALIPFTNGELGTPTFHSHPGIDNPEVHTPHLEWHPSGRFLAATMPVRNEAVFYAMKPCFMRSIAQIQTAHKFDRGVTRSQLVNILVSDISLQMDDISSSQTSTGAKMLPTNLSVHSIVASQ